MKKYIKFSGSSNSIFEDLAKRIAEYFNEDIEGEFDGWEDYAMAMQLTGPDLKEEIISTLNYEWDKDRKQNKGHYSIGDNGTIYAGDDECSYRKFKNLVMKYVIHDSEDTFDDEE